MTPDGEGEVVKQLKSLNAHMAAQNSYGRMFMTGIVYGVGFFVGSAIIATIVFGIVGPILGKIGWLNAAYQAGLFLLHR